MVKYYFFKRLVFLEKFFHTQSLQRTSVKYHKLLTVDGVM